MVGVAIGGADPGAFGRVVRIGLAVGDITWKKSVKELERLLRLIQIRPVPPHLVTSSSGSSDMAGSWMVVAVRLGVSC